MNSRSLLRMLAALLLVGIMGAARGQPAVESGPAASAAAASDDWTTDDGQGRPDDRSSRHRHRRDRSDRDEVGIGHDSTLEAGRRANSVVSVLGSATAAGDAVDVVSVVGDTRVTGSTQADAVSVMGTTTIDGKVGGDAVAVLGDVELGPHAEVDGDVIAVLGTVHRDPAAIVHGEVQSVLGGVFGAVDWLRSWIRHCLLFGRPLAPLAELGWAWEIACGFLVFYAFLALLFPAGTERCVRTFEAHPGRSLLAAIIGTLLLPVVFVLLCVTVIGIAAVPFVATALFCIGLFGRAVMLAWLGWRLVGRRGAGPLAHPALAVLIGGAVVLVLYMVPVLGFLLFQLIGVLGFGAVLYTIILAARDHQAARNAAAGRVGPQPHAATGSDAGPASGPGAAPTAAPHVTASLPRAGFWIRMAALVIDLLLVGVLMGFLHHGYHLQLLVLAAYGAVMWKLRGSTVGGIVFDLRVVRLDGREVDWETAIVRALGCFLSLAVAGLGFMWIAFDDSNQAWHDKIAGTVVVRVPKGIPLV